jgi:hypothetical protein
MKQDTLCKRMGRWPEEHPATRLFQVTKRFDGQTQGPSSPKQVLGSRPENDSNHPQESLKNPKSSTALTPLFEPGFSDHSYSFYEGIAETRTKQVTWRTLRAPKPKWVFAVALVLGVNWFVLALIGMALLQSSGKISGVRLPVFPGDLRSGGCQAALGQPDRSKYIPLRQTRTEHMPP